MSRSQSRVATRSPVLGLNLELLIVLLIMAILIFAHTARAESTSRSKTSKTTITTTVSEGSGTNTDIDATPTPSPDEDKEFLVTKTFGSKAQSGTAGCKTEELSQQVVRDLESECNAWIKKQKGELRKKFQTGTCEESCTDCGMSLKRCTVTGTVHYSKK